MAQPVEIPLSELTILLNRGISPSYLDEGGVCVLNQRCIRDQAIVLDNQRRTDPLRRKIPNDKLLKVGDILVNSTGVGTLGRVAQLKDLVEDSMTVDSHVTIVRANTELILPRFLGFAVRSKETEITSMGTGATGQTELSRANLGELLISVPPLPTQKKIASVLSAYDDLIENNERRIKILEEMAQAIYREWFVNYRFPGHENVRMVDSELGEIPEGWKVTGLLSLMDIQGGTQPPKSTFTSTASDDSIRLIQIRDFESDSHITYIANSTKWRKCQDDDVLIARYGASLGRILRGMEGAYNVALAKVVPTNGSLEFLYYFLLSEYFQESLLNRGSRTAQSGFNKEDLNSILLTAPSIYVQELFAKQAVPMWRLKKMLLKQQNQLRQTRDLLLPKLISGELQVEELDIPVA